MTPLVSIQKPGPEKFQEMTERELANFSVLKKKPSPRHGGGNGEKKQSPRTLGLYFFPTPFFGFLPLVWDYKPLKMIQGIFF